MPNYPHIKFLSTRCRRPRQVCLLPAVQSHTKNATPARLPPSHPATFVSYHDRCVR
ncbi:hypothetical protein CPAR01_06042 [Colletotrichum paranaense]|uniref:Uncharacterized protein n=1 Tax=Colletotrichum paranaense TaxID=1914294 RepID=A0ABQ9ST12_9PEZI|nr:uncharacterized protein CPAR01_06042 [Colletotrichum paranaense]KAK1542655.1 hypothetical protein CPAR01_06042 [Colletotrichum paranaense]